MTAETDRVVHGPEGDTAVRNARIVLVVGASSGIGAACTARLRARGDRVFAASRRAADEALVMDVDSDRSVDVAVAAMLAHAGRVDAIIYCAGHALAGPVEATSAKEVQEQLETNVVGLWRVCGAVLPTMRAQRRGHIIVIGSLAGRIGLPFQAAYCASKFAVAGFAEALRTEVEPYGIHVSVVEPGNLRTPFTATRRIARAARDGFYGARFRTALERIEREELGGGSADSVAAMVERMLDDRNPPLRRSAGPVLERLAVLASAVLPRRLVDWAIIRRYGGRDGDPPSPNL
jgi:NAD(P)-dependent dehydrogenase (short-subunit alcohol dehydrogenase family)